MNKFALPEYAIPIIEALREKSSFVIAPHGNMDGDALGSMLALYHTLVKMGKEVYAYSVDGVPKDQHFLAGWENIKPTPPPSPLETAILLECSYPERISGEISPEKLGSFKINIDHHPQNGFYCDLNWVDPEMSSCAEMVYYIVRELEGLNRDTASALYLGILTDTGAFQFSNVNSHTHAIISELLEFDVPGSEIIREIYRAKPVGYLHLLGRVAGTLNRKPDGSAAWADLTYEMVETCGLEKDELQTLIDDLNRIKDTDVLIFFKEMEKGKVKVSLRSNDFHVNLLARHFGGGGHSRAAAFDYNGTLEEAREDVLSALGEMQKQPDFVNTGG